MGDPDQLGQEIAGRKSAEDHAAHRKLETQRASLLDSEERFRLLVEGTREYAIFLLDPHGHIVSWNQGAERIKQYRAEEIIGRHFSIFYPPEEVQAGKPARELELAAAQGKYEEEGWRVRKDGSRFFASVLITALRDEAGNLRGFGKVTRDITERKQAEENACRLVAEEAARRAAEQNAALLHEERERLRITLQSIGDAVIATDAAGRVTLLNPVAEALTGWKVEEAVGKPLPAVFHIVNEETRSEVENPADRALREGVIVGLANHTVLIGRRGVECCIGDSAAPIKDEKGEVRGVVLVFRDCTRDREASRRKDEFLATLAHELRNPLAPIRNAVQIMRMHGLADAQLQWARAVIERQVGQMARLVDDLLDIARINRGKIELRKQIVPLADIVNRAVETTASLYQDRGHTLHVTMPPQPVVLEADPARMEQVLGNLLDNSAKYTEKRGKVWLTAAVEGETVVIRVRDTGMGMTADLLPRVFEMFVQAPQGKACSAGGLGIGLSLVRSIAEMHGGSVTASSAGPGQGSEFVLRLPVYVPPRQTRGRRRGADTPAGATSAPASATSEASSSGRVGCRLLVVDDNVDAAESLAMLLRMQGHNVRVAHDGPAALAAVHADPPQAIFLDIGMPGMDGYEVARRIRQKGAARNIYLIALTGWGQDEDRRRSRAAGFNQHLVKPVDPDVVERLLSHELVYCGKLVGGSLRDPQEPA